MAPAHRSGGRGGVGSGGRGDGQRRGLGGADGNNSADGAASDGDAAAATAADSARAFGHCCPLYEQGPRYIKLPHMRLALVHEKYWLAILHKDKLVEFR